MILLTGATGQIGRPLSALMQDAGLGCRVLARRPETVDRRGLEVIGGALEDREALRRSLEGIERVFLLTKPSAEQARLEATVHDEARRAGCGGIVRISAIDARPDAASAMNRSHAACEAIAEASPVPTLSLAPHFFMQNLTRLAPRLRAKGSFALPIGSTRAAIVDARDVAAAAFAALTAPVMPLGRIALTGPRPLSFAEVAEIIARAAERPIRFESVSRASMVEGLSRAGFSPWHAEALADLYADFVDGLVVDGIERLTGRPPRTLEDFVREHAGEFRSPEAPAAS